MSKLPPLKPLHAETSLSEAKLSYFDRLSSEHLKKSLEVGRTHCLKAKPDGTILDGHHRLHILKSRGLDIDALQREVLT